MHCLTESVVFDPSGGHRFIVNEEDLIRYRQLALNLMLGVVRYSLNGQFFFVFTRMAERVLI